MTLSPSPRFSVLAGVLLVTLSVAGGYVFGVRSHRSFPGSTPTTPSPSSMPSPMPVSASPTSLNPAVQGEEIVTPFPDASAVRPVPSSNAPRVRFVDLPSRIRAGQSLVVRWRVDGPPGTLVETTTLETRTSQSTSGSGSSASSASSSKQTFGGVPAPQVFSATVTLGGNARQVVLSVTATVGGREVSAGPVSVAIE